MKLNLGCENKIIEWYINVDKFDLYEVDINDDLEKFPYPFEDDPVQEIIIPHVLEHIGQSQEIFINILKELFRVCKNQALIKISVHHPRYDSFISDPTHVRPIIILAYLYLTELWKKNAAANTPLALIHDFNFSIEDNSYDLEDVSLTKFKIGEIDKPKFDYMINHYNNIITQINIKWRVIK